MKDTAKVKSQVKQFYDSVGWKRADGEAFEDTRFEDLRTVSRDYISRCRLRVAHHLPSVGKFLLDAGSGPIQYPEYLEFSRGFQYRVCLDFSILALREARSRIGDHGLFVLGDVTNLPFAGDAVDGLVSMHVVYHLPAEQQWRAYEEFYRVLSPGGKAVVVYSWGGHAAIPRYSSRVIALITRVRGGIARRLRRGSEAERSQPDSPPKSEDATDAPVLFSHKHDFSTTLENLKHMPGLQIRVWRSVSTPFLRTFAHTWLLGKLWLRLLNWWEELAPHFLGRVGQYPMILFRKPSSPTRLEDHLSE